MDIVSFGLYLLIVAAIFSLFLFLAKKAPFEEPFKSYVIWFVYVVGVLLLIALLLSLFGHPLHPVFNLTPLRLR